MNTPAHLLFGAALLGHAPNKKLTIAALVGAMLPDFSLYFLGGVSLFILGLEPDYVFGVLYYSDIWQKIFAIDNSFFLWGGLLALAYWQRLAVLGAFAGGGFLHLLLDFPLHHDDGRAHFWPLSDWVFESPLSYWDGAHFANYIIPLEGGLALWAGIYLIQRFRHWGWRSFFALLIGMQLFTATQWVLFFF